MFALLYRCVQHSLFSFFFSRTVAVVYTFFLPPNIFMHVLCIISGKFVNTSENLSCETHPISAAYCTHQSFNLRFSVINIGVSERDKQQIQQKNMKIEYFLCDHYFSFAHIFQCETISFWMLPAKVSVWDKICTHCKKKCDCCEYRK